MARITDRGVVFSSSIDDLFVLYLTGKNADVQTPVFNMSLGEITLENIGERPINVKYNASQTFFSGHSFKFGAQMWSNLGRSREASLGLERFIDYNISPGKTIVISRQDLMDIVERKGPAYLQDGTICTRFEAALQVDGKTYPLEFGPHCFHVALDRDWDVERARYLQFFVDRDRG